MNVPNLLTLLRMALIPFFAISVLQGHPGQAIGTFVVAGLSDALDGAIARLFDQVTHLGAYLDPIADKLLLTTAYLLLAVPGLYPGLQIPIWVTVLVIARDLLILTIGLVLRLAAGVSNFPPTFLSKMNTSAQFVAVILVLATALRPGLAGTALAAVYLVAGSTVLSGLDYAYRASRLVGSEDHAPA